MSIILAVGEPVYETILAFPFRLWWWLVWGQTPRRGWSGRKPPPPTWSNPPEVIVHVYGRGWIFKGTPEGDAYERAWLWRTLAEGICAASWRRTCMTAKYPRRIGSSTSPEAGSSRLRNAEAHEDVNQYSPLQRQVQLQNMV
jgi:hypothetical protein